jgi:acyl dehydratase
VSGTGPPSHLRAALRVVARRLRRRGDAAAPTPAIPRRRLAAESQAITCDPRRVKRYLRISAGTPSGRPASELVPPLYSSLWETALALELFASDELPFPARGIIHLESEVVCVRPFRLDDRIRCRVELDAAEKRPRGLRLSLKSRHWNGSGQLCQENALTFLVPGASAPEGAGGVGGAGGEKEVEEPVGSAWVTLEDWDLPSNLGRKYAWVSGDVNPIHLWRWSSRLLGFDRPILHGYCTASMVASSLARAFWDGDPGALRRLGIRFGTPLSLPGRARLVAETAGGSAGAGRFRVIDPDRPERRPFAEGEFVGG